MEEKKLGLDLTKLINKDERLSHDCLKKWKKKTF